MKFLAALVLSLFTLTANATANNNERWIVVGDSIQSSVVGSGNANQLAWTQIQNQIPQLIIQNLSSPGARMSDGGAVGFGAVNFKTSLNFTSGFFGAKGVIITLGTNDWGAADTGKLFADYKAYVEYARALKLEVVCISPIWREDQATNKTVANGTWNLDVYRWVISEACKQGGGKYVEGGNSPLNGQLQYYGDSTSPRVHLNGTGQTVFASWVINQMRLLGYW